MAGDGQGLVVVFNDITLRKVEDERRRRELEWLLWVGRIKEALDEHRFVLHAQPIIALPGRRTVAYELLLRMIDRDGTVIAPNTFLPVAERFDLIGEIDRWVTTEAVKLAATGVSVHFNLSGKSLVDRDLVAEIKRLLSDFDADPGLLVCEITETAIAADQALAQAFVRQLAALGLRLALDDFGTGYGGLTYLKRLQVELVKIDIEFVRDLPENPESQHVVKAIVNLAQGFGRKTVAEGVENEKTLELLEGLGVDYAQGFWIGRPAPLEDGDPTRPLERAGVGTHQRTLRRGYLSRRPLLDPLVDGGRPNVRLRSCSGLPSRCARRSSKRCRSGLSSWRCGTAHECRRVAATDLLF